MNSNYTYLLLLFSILLTKLPKVHLLHCRDYIFVKVAFFSGCLMAISGISLVCFYHHHTQRYFFIGLQLNYHLRYPLIHYLLLPITKMYVSNKHQKSVKSVIFYFQESNGTSKNVLFCQKPRKLSDMRT